MIARNPIIWAGALDGDPASKGRAGVVFDGELDHLRKLRAMDAGGQGEGHVDAGRCASGPLGVRSGTVMEPSGQ